MQHSRRASGILLHPTSLPGRFGIGDLGSAARRFVDFLADSGQQLWQIMPLGPTAFGDSPYQAVSAFAGNPSLISLERLVEEKYLAPWDFLDAPDFPAQAVDYGPVIEYKQRLLRLSFENFKNQPGGKHAAEFAAFCAANRGWLDDYALFVALKEEHGGANWSDWERDIATRQPAALAHWQAELADAIQYHRYTQFQFYKQWSALKRYANRKGIQIIGDIPIFVAYDSADAWSHPELFWFDEDGRPTLVAGVPPDYFSPTGQLWGNPLYRWDVLARRRLCLVDRAFQGSPATGRRHPSGSFPRVRGPLGRSRQRRDRRKRLLDEGPRRRPLSRWPSGPSDGCRSSSKISASSTAALRRCAMSSAFRA